MTRAFIQIVGLSTHSAIGNQATSLHLSLELLTVRIEMSPKPRPLAHPRVASRRPGYIGKDCGVHCPAGKYGRGCRLSCNCANNATCSHEDGRCQCTAGWHGISCSAPCPTGRFGLGCNSTCRCDFGGACNPVNGES